ncbi:hypothetical protein [Streptomyces sp. ERV7]|uniref:hypothetical protein n=1 Tax=Streptomyces sp. ERV7 TaxID=1322334 RepID=UPI003B63493F
MLTLSSGARKPVAEPWFSVVADAFEAVEVEADDDVDVWVRGAAFFVPDACEPLVSAEPCDVPEAFAEAFAPRTSFMPGRISAGSEPTTSRLSW